MPDYSTQIRELLEITIKEQASDLHISVDHPPVLRIAGRLVPLVKMKKLDVLDSQGLSFALLSDEQKQRILNVR